MEKVSILLSIYKPNLTYLALQLNSLNNQDYENLEVIINDDCPESPCPIYIFEQYLTKVPYKILKQNKSNLNYIKSFEKLVKNSDGKYIAFCDQDDIWFSNKISKSVSTLKKENALLVASDKQIIDEDGNVIIDSVRKKSNKPYDNWKTGDDIAKYNLIITYSVGMALVLDGDFARSAIPFSNYTGHDKWLISCAATEGKVAYIEEPLVQYRRHGRNVSGVLIGINTKEDYLKQRVLPDINAIYDFLRKYPFFKDKNDVLGFAEARKNHNLIKLFKYRYLAPDIAKFDICLCFVPNFAFKFLIYLARKFS